MNNVHLYTALLAVLLGSCTPAPEPPSPPAPFTRNEVRLRDSLALLRTDYDQLQLHQALARARRMRVQVEIEQDSVGADLRAEVYQYLAMLHFERERWLDSIRYFTARADALITPTMSPAVSARQALCWAYVSYHDWAMREMELYTALGLNYLQGTSAPDPHLRGLLLTARGHALKQLGDRMKAQETQEMTYAESEAAFRGALDTLRAARLPRYYHTLEELGILLTRLPVRQGELDALVRELREAEDADPARLPRLLGYAFRKRGIVDSAIVYYRQLLRTEHFAHGYLLEGQYFLLDLLRQSGRFSEALTVSDSVMAYYGCCAGGDPDRPCARKSQCVFVLAEHAEILRQRFVDAGDPDDLRAAYQLIRGAVHGYQEALSRISHEGTYNQTVSHGDLIITTAMRTLYALQAARLMPPDSVRAAAFEAVEFGKAHSLALELSQLARQRADGDNQVHYLELSEVKGEIDLLKNKSARDGGLSAEELADFAALMQKRRPLALISEVAYAAAQRAGETPFGTPLPVVAVQGQLRHGEALLELLETEDGVYGVYVDRDTVITYTIDSVVRTEAVAFQALVQDPKSDLQRLSELGGALYDRLFGPAAEVLARRSHLILSPCASLQGLPMAALRPTGEGGGQYLIQRHTLRYVDSWRTECINRKQRREFGRGAFATAGIWTHPGLTNYLGGLADQLLAAPDIRGRHFTAAAATTASLLEKAPDYDLLQLSVHARGNPRQLNENYLYLSARDSISGIRIGALHLRARLVVLAACSTARGWSERREGTYSLRRSFHLAGVPDVVASQFDIPAKTTELLIAEFYTQLFAGHAPEAALAGAQQLFADAGAGYARWKHPHYWAGLSLS